MRRAGPGAQALSTEANRREARVAAAFRVRYATVDQLVVAYTHDLSRGRMFLRTRQALALGTLVRVHVELPESGAAELALVARVTGVRPAAEAEPGRPPGMSVAFVDLTSEHLARIEGFIAERATAEGDAAAGPRRQRLHVLVVDDDDAYRDLAAAPFRERGDIVRTAVDGLEGLGACLKDAPDVILSDVQMPRMDGWQLLRMVRARRALARIPVLFLTTLRTDGDRLKGYQLGVDDYVPKPVDPDELAARVDRVMARIAGADQGATRVERRSLRGDLEQVALASVLTFLEMERKTGVLVVSAERAGRIWVRDGRPLRASIDGEADVGRDAIFRLLGWSYGEFELRAEPVDGEDDVEMSCTALVLESARLSDELGR